MVLQFSHPVTEKFWQKTHFITVVLEEIKLKIPGFHWNM